MDKPRVVDIDVAKYLQSVNDCMARDYGIKYATKDCKISESLHGDLSAMKAAFASGVSAAEFVRGMGEQFGFRHTGDAGAQAADYNARKAALVEFAREGDDWEIAGGNVYRQDSAGLVRFEPVFNDRQRKWGFAVHLAPDAGLVESNGRKYPTAHESEFEFASAAIDIGDAMQRFRMKYPDQEMKLMA